MEGQSLAPLPAACCRTCSPGSCAAVRRRARIATRCTSRPVSVRVRLPSGPARKLCTSSPAFNCLPQPVCTVYLEPVSDMVALHRLQVALKEQQRHLIHFTRVFSSIRRTRNIHLQSVAGLALLYGEPRGPHLSASLSLRGLHALLLRSSVIGDTVVTASNRSRAP